MHTAETKSTPTELHFEPSVLETYYAPDAADRTVEGVVELMTGLRESMQAVRSDWRTVVAGDRQLLEQLAAPHVERINVSRRKDHPEEPDIAVSEISENFLLGLAEPDYDKGYDEYPRENAQLAMATVATQRGELPPDIDEGDFENFVRAARLSQQIFSGTNGEGYNQFIDTEKMVDDRPGLEETVLAPRTMVDILHKVAGSYGTVSLKRACQTFLDGIKNPNDRQVIHHILEYHDLLPEEMLGDERI